VKYRTLQKKIYIIKKITQNIKEELDKDMENLRKKNQTEILEIKIPSVKKKCGGRPLHRLEQVEDRVS
jgi:hypothetical protein